MEPTVNEKSSSPVRGALLILRRGLSELRLETLAEVTRVVDTYHVRNLSHVELARPNQLSGTLDAHLLDKLDGSQSGERL